MFHRMAEVHMDAEAWPGAILSACWELHAARTGYALASFLYRIRCGCSAAVPNSFRRNAS